MPEQPILETPRLILRPFTLADAADVQRLAGDRKVADTTLNIPHPYEDGMAEAWISSHAADYDAGDMIRYAVTVKGGEGSVGAVSLQVARRHCRAELAYWIGFPYWGRGYATEASKALVDYGFGVMALHKINAAHFARNPASGRVMQKLGMSLEGILRDHYRKGDGFDDSLVYGLIAPNG